MATTIGESISRIRNVVKSVKEDAFMTDRFIYSLIVKYSKTLIERDSEIKNLILSSGLCREIPCIDLIEVNTIDACCTSLKTKCTVFRSKDPLPKIVILKSNYLIRYVSSLDYSKKAIQTAPDLYANMRKTSGFKYNKNAYFWIVENYLYLANAEWDLVKISALFDENIDAYLQNCSAGQTIKDCILEQDRELNIPEYLFSEIEALIIKELLTSGQIPPDGPDDNQNIMR